MRYLGIDYGSKKIGLAVSDESGRVAFPLQVIPNTKKLLAEVVAICRQENIAKIICGLSLDFSGQDNPIAKEAKDFCNQLISEINLPLEFENEFLTSVFAGQISPQNKEIDARAAALILQRFLDRTKNNS
ncbi:MAG: Holliday junction resolvase RuvX [Candidatus Paceibacterota bacterium]|jgi:putative Holliday junction resolvase